MLVFSPSLWSWYLLHFFHACLNLLWCDLAIAQCSCFVKHLEYITVICFVVMLECNSLVSCCILSGIVLLIAELCHPCFACHLQTVHPIPVILISISTEIISSFQRHTWFAKLMPCSSFPFWSTHMHCISHLAYHAMYCIMLLVHFPWLIVVPLLVFLLWVEPGDDFVNEEPVEYAYEDQAFDNSENLAGKMTIPSKSLLSLLASCSLYCYAAPPITCYIMPPKLPWNLL